ncbi:hypothetical protein PTKIN_Ptkin03bG0150500 [Pterospermum kingtungense]
MDFSASSSTGCTTIASMTTTGSQNSPLLYTLLVYWNSFQCRSCEYGKAPVGWIHVWCWNRFQKRGMAPGALNTMFIAPTTLIERGSRKVPVKTR